MLLRAILLFITGFFLAVFSFPIAFAYSVALGYACGLAAVIIAAYLISKRKSSTMSFVLGLVLLLFFALPALFILVSVHLGLLTLKMIIGVPQHSVLKIGKKSITVDGWKITVVGVKYTKYIIEDDSYYSAAPGEKIVVVTLKIENLENNSRFLSTIWDFLLVSNTGESYKRVLEDQLNWIPPFRATQTIKEEAVHVHELNFFGEVAPRSYVLGDVLFQLPLNQTAKKLVFRVGILHCHEVELIL
ncbi:MAG: DUF4352 domain-containing protein [bacterium]|nr:DUF4352 domain-containing protein [bacterium]